LRKITSIGEGIRDVWQVITSGMARPIINKENIETKLEVRDDLAGPE
jgi:hypothetical protein